MSNFGYDDVLLKWEITGTREVHTRYKYHSYECKYSRNKNYLHKLIVETDDESILSKVQAYFNTLKGKNIDWRDTPQATGKRRRDTA